MSKFRKCVGTFLMMAALCCAFAQTQLWADPAGPQGQGTSGPQSPNPSPQDLPDWVLWLYSMIVK